MYALSHRASVPRHISRSTIYFSRSNSTSKGPEDSEESVPATPAPPSSARIASSWGNINIPSREEILRNSQAQTYKPDLSYLKKAKSTGIASRLFTNNQLPLGSDASHNAQKESSQPRESDDKRDARIQAITLERKAKREAREKAAAEASRAAQEAQEARTSAKEAIRRAASERGAQITAERIAERLRREAIVSPHQRRENIQREQPRSSRGTSPRVAQGGSKPSRPTRPKFMVQAMPSQDSSLANSKDDITLEIIEAGGDEKEPPQFTNPHIAFTDFDALFKPPLAQRVEREISSEVSSFTKNQMQKLRRTYGGDYQRFSLQSSQDCITPPDHLGPLKHARLVLAQRRELSLGARENTLTIISSAVGGSSGTKEVQTVVN